METTDVNTRPLSALLSDAAGYLRRVIALDWALLRHEVDEKLAHLRAAGLAGGIAACCFAMSAIAILEFLILGLIWLGVAGVWAALLVAMVFAAVGALAARSMSRHFGHASPVPEATVAQVRADLSVIAEGLKNVAR